MNDTEQLFLMALIWALIAMIVARFIPNWPGRVVFFTVAVAIPFWELPYGYFNFQRLCREESGLKVFESIGPQRIICVDYPYETAAIGMLKAGFSSVEARDKDGGVRRYSKSLFDNIESFNEPRVSSEYCVTHSFVRGLPWRTMRNELVIVRANDKHMVARHGEFVWFGMWWQEAALPVLGRGGECRRDAVGAVAGALREGLK